MMPPAESAMSMSFDPYAEWLEIPDDRRPPTYYDLLGLAPFEGNSARIMQAAVDRTALVRRYQLGPHADAALKLISELSVAFDCLADIDRKRDYDARLRAAATAPGAGGAARGSDRDDSWFYQLGDRVLGPVDTFSLEQLVTSGVITRQTPIMDDLDQRWQLAGYVAGLPFDRASWSTVESTFARPEREAIGPAAKAGSDKGPPARSKAASSPGDRLLAMVKVFRLLAGAVALAGTIESLALASLGWHFLVVVNLGLLTILATLLLSAGASGIEFLVAHCQRMEELTQRQLEQLRSALPSPADDPFADLP